jgi:uncharacterized protein (TIGR02246 family)
MPARTLEEHYELFAAAFNAGDAGALMELYADDAVLIPEPGTAARGSAAVSEALGGFLALKGTMDLKLRGSVEGPSTAITYGAWKLDATGDDGAPITMSGESTEVLAKEPDGTWRIVLDDPWSCAG